MHCPLSKAGLSGPGSFAISVSAALKLLAMSFDWPHARAIRAQYSKLFPVAEGSACWLKWHRDHEAVSHCLTAILQMAQT